MRWSPCCGSLRRRRSPSSSSSRWSTSSSTDADGVQPTATRVHRRPTDVTVYVEDDDALGACTLTADDGSTFQMETLDLSTDFEVDTTGPTLAPFASTPDDLPAGTYAISCDGGDSTVLATGDRIDEDSLDTAHRHRLHRFADPRSLGARLAHRVARDAAQQQDPHP